MPVLIKFSTKLIYLLTAYGMLFLPLRLKTRLSLLKTDLIVRTIQKSRLKDLSSTEECTITSIRGEVCNSVSGYIVYRHVLNHNGLFLGTCLHKKLDLAGLERWRWRLPQYYNFYGSQYSVKENFFSWEKKQKMVLFQL